MASQRKSAGQLRVGDTIKYSAKVAQLVLDIVRDRWGNVVVTHLDQNYGDGKFPPVEVFDPAEMVRVVI